MINYYINKFISNYLSKKRKAYIKHLQRRGMKIGINVEIVDNFFFDPSHCFLIEIGDNSVISPNVRLIAHDASTKKHLGYTKIGLIKIMKNCYIGDSVIILPNVTVGAYSIIGAGSVVTRDIPPRVIAAGNPAKVISNLEKYLEKIKSIEKNKRIFSEEYYIENIDNKMRAEIICSIGDSIGFIV